MSEPSNEARHYAGFWIRSIAAIVDILLSAVILLPILVAVYGREYFSIENLLRLQTHAAGALDLLTWVATAAAVVLFWIYREATPGKMMVGVRIVDAKSGGHPSTQQLIGRFLGYYVSILPLGLGILWVAFDARKQGFHDKLAGTVVIRTPRRTAGTEA